MGSKTKKINPEQLARESVCKVIGITDCPEYGSLDELIEVAQGVVSPAGLLEDLKSWRRDYFAVARKAALAEAKVRDLQATIADLKCRTYKPAGTFELTRKGQNTPYFLSPEIAAMSADEFRKKYL